MSDSIAVVMNDGRSVTFGKVQKVKKEILLATDGQPTAIRFDARNGDSETVQIDDLPSTLLGHLIAHGLSQKLGDEYSDVASPSDCMETMRQLWQRLLKGSWNSERQGFSGSGILFEACKLAYPDMSPEAIREILNGMSPKEKAAFKASDPIKPFVMQVETSRNAGVDVSGLLAKFKAA